MWNLLHASTTPTAVKNYELTPLPNPVTVNATTTYKAISTATHTEEKPVANLPIAPQTYLEITGGCTITTDSTCYRAFSQPDPTSTERAMLRVGTVLSVKSSTTTGGILWYEIDFPENLRYAERLTLPWYVPAEAGEIVRVPGAQDISSTTPTTTKRILVDRSDQKLYTYDGETLVQTYTISAGRELTPTPRGTFTVYRMTPSRYMQGPIPGISINYYDLPGVPWNLYFTTGGAVVHGAYWHNDFGNPHSNGCVNLPPEDAKEIYYWAVLGMKITVQD